MLLRALCAIRSSSSISILMSILMAHLPAPQSCIRLSLGLLRVFRTTLSSYDGRACSQSLHFISIILFWF